MVSGRSSQSGFKGFEDSDKAPVVDFIGAGKGDRVLLSWDGWGSQEYFNNPKVPQRAWLCGIIDETDER